MLDANGRLIRLTQILPSLERIAGGPLRVWRFDGRRVQPLAGRPADWTPALDAGRGPGALTTPEGPAWFEPVPAANGLWLETGIATGRDPAALAEIVGSVLDSEREIAQVAAELSERYEEIDLLYTISEILGHTIRLSDAAQNILREVSQVVGARRATLFIYEPGYHELRLVAARGVAFEDVEPIDVDDQCSIAARVFREGKIQCHDPGDPTEPNVGCPTGRHYRGQAYLSVPVIYAAPGGPPRPIGVINLTDRLGEDAFTSGDRKLVAAIANQVGAAIENARLRERDQRQQRLHHELELAHDLQLKLLPAPEDLGTDVDVAARCVPADTVGGDFYQLVQLPGNRVGVMLGDVSSRGFPAALIMALVLSAAGIHAVEAASPDRALRRLLDSVADELAGTEMHLSLFYGVPDAAAGRLRYANAGHPHAFRLAADGRAERLRATSPPLGLTDPAAIAAADAPWRDGDVLLLFSDGLTDACDARGESFGEERVVETVVAHRTAAAQTIVDAVFRELDTFAAECRDDRTILVLRA